MKSKTEFNIADKKVDNKFKSKKKEIKTFINKKRERNYHLNVSKKRKDYQKIEINNKIIIKPIKKIFEQTVIEWKENKDNSNCNLKNFCEKMEIFGDCNYEYSNLLLKENIDEFLSFYSKYQFTLSFNQRLEIQKKLTNITEPMIKYNLIEEKYKSIREIYLSLCKSLTLIKNTNKNNLISTLKECFIKHCIYSNQDFEYRFPIIFGNYELQYSKLAIGTLHFFFGLEIETTNNNEEEKINLINEKLGDFQDLETFFSMADLYDDDILLEICNYLLNCYYMLYKVNYERRDYNKLKTIISCCYPFKLEIAKKRINEMKEFCDFTINNINIKKFNVETLSPDFDINFLDDKKNITVKVKEVNWYLEYKFLWRNLKTDNFMLCFHYSQMKLMNYLLIDKEIKEKYYNLYSIIIKSDIMKDAMNNDNEAINFLYPFTNNEIIKEVEERVILVPFPVQKCYGYTDKIGFTIYLNSFINSMDIYNTFIDIDNILITKSHELKHLYRVYFHVFNPKISLKTPNIKVNHKRNIPILIQKQDFEDKKREYESVLEERGIFINEINDLDYGDLFEISLNGAKMDVFFIKNCFFCLTEKSWKLPSKQFKENFFKSYYCKSFFLKNNKKNEFISAVMKFFKFPTNLKMTNEGNLSKRASKAGNQINKFPYLINQYEIRIKLNHCHTKKFSK